MLVASIVVQSQHKFVNFSRDKNWKKNTTTSCILISIIKGFTGYDITLEGSSKCR